MLGLESLARGAVPHEVLDDAAHVGEVEVALQPVPGALNAFMPIVMDRSNNLLEQGRCRRGVEAPVIEYHVVPDRPWSGSGARAHLVVDRDQGRVDGLCLAETADVVKARCRDGAETAHAVILSIATREGVRHDVGCPGLVLDGEVEAEQLANPMVLGNGGKALIQQKLEAMVVRLDEEVAAPQIWPPVPHCEHEANELPLIRR